MKLAIGIVVSGLMFGVCRFAVAQSFNIDLDELGGSAQIGNGAPSALFPGAAVQLGYWNRIYDGGSPIPVSLLGLDGSSTSCQIQTTGSFGSGGGFNNPNLSGDFRLLMADFADVGDPIQYHFSGINSGHYRITTLGGSVSGRLVDLYVRVPGAAVENQVITGPINSNIFAYGVDFCTHDLLISGHSFEIDVSGEVWPSPTSSVGGFQIVAVPEPYTLFALLLGSIALLVRRRPRM